MKIGEILELTQSKKMADIAKDHLTIGEKPAREALKLAGCYSISGKKGWYFDGDKSVLEQSIYDFTPAKKINRDGTVKPEANVSTKTPNEPRNGSANEHNSHINKPTNVDMERVKEEFEQANKEVAPTLSQSNQRTNVVRKRSSFDIDVNLMKELKIQAIMHDKNVYEIVENAIRKELAELKKGN